MRTRLSVLLVAVLTSACGSSGAASVPSTTLPPSSTTAVTPTTVLENGTVDPTGEVTVTMGDRNYQFLATRCLVVGDVFVIDGVSVDGTTTVAIRHASPPTRPDPQPSMSYLLIEPEPDFQSAPAAVTFDRYDPEAGIATGTVDQGVTFTVQCER